MSDEPDAVAEWSAARRRISLLVALLDPTVANSPVPATPDWSVHDLLAHMIGLDADVVAGDEPDDHNAGWTQRHVDDGAAAVSPTCWPSGTALPRSSRTGCVPTTPGRSGT